MYKIFGTCWLNLTCKADQELLLGIVNCLQFKNLLKTDIFKPCGNIQKPTNCGPENETNWFLQSIGGYKKILRVFWLEIFTVWNVIMKWQLKGNFGGQDKVWKTRKNFSGNCRSAVKPQYDPNPGSLLGPTRKAEQWTFALHVQ